MNVYKNTICFSEFLRSKDGLMFTNQQKTASTNNNFRKMFININLTLDHLRYMESNESKNLEKSLSRPTINIRCPWHACFHADDIFFPGKPSHISTSCNRCIQHLLQQHDLLGEAGCFHKHIWHIMKQKIWQRRHMTAEKLNLYTR